MVYLIFPTLPLAKKIIDLIEKGGQVRIVSQPLQEILQVMHVSFIYICYTRLQTPVGLVVAMVEPMLIHLMVYHEQ